MPSPSLPVLVVAVLLLAALIGACANHLTLTLERANHDGVELSRLRDRDRARHAARFLQQRLPNGVVDFPVSGTYNPFVAGLYYTKVTLGSPPRDFYVQIDTGSDVLWVNCNPCSGCPKSSGLKIPISFFNPSSSSTSSVVSCSDNVCGSGTVSSDSLCTNQGQCGYKFMYGDGSGASGYYVSDTINLETITANAMPSSFSTPVVFGCSTLVTGGLTKSDSAVDGIFGFGQRGLSVIAQLSSQGITPNAFSHCLSGQSGGGGILALGKVVNPNLVYTPMVPSQPHYNVNLQSIDVDGERVAINPSVFATSATTGTIIDSGTTLAYLADSAYDPVINAIIQAASRYAQYAPYKENQCFLTVSRVSDVFPNVSLNFANGASMVLTPQNYLLSQGTNSGSPIYCIGLLKTGGQDLTILGDIVLKDRVVVYDIAGQSIGWTDYDCSSSVTISTSNSNTTESVNGGLLNKNSNSSGFRHHPFKLIHGIAMALLLHLAFFGVYNTFL